MAKISKPDANPVVAALLCLIFNLGHLVINGQSKKFALTLLVILLLYCTLCGGIIVLILSMIDAYKTAEKLKAGKEIDEHEYSFKPLYSLMKIIHKEAVFVE